MKLDSLTLENFKQYHGSQRIIFSQYEQKPVTVIHGINGAGKTSMFTAMNWCLYGADVIDAPGELVCKKAVMDVPAGQLVECSAELAFSHDGQRYRMTRRVSMARQLDGQIHAHNNEEVTLYRIDASGNPHPENSPLSTINAILPANVRTYFLFDGEKIDDFAKPDAAGEVKDAIYLVLRLEVLDRARKHLRYLEKQYRKEAVELSGDSTLKELEQALGAAEASLEAAQEELARQVAAVESAERKIAEIDAELEGKKEVAQLQKDRRSAENRLKRERKNLEELIGEIQSSASRAYLITAQPIIAQAIAVLDEKRQKGQIPSNIRQQFIQDLLDNMECVCGRPLREHSDEYERLATLMNQSVSSQLESAVLDTNTTLHTLKTQGGALSADLNRQLKDHEATKERIRAYEGEVSDLQLQLKDSPLEDISTLEKTRQSFRRDADDAKIKQGRLRERIDQQERAIQKQKETLLKAQRSNDQSKYLAVKQRIAGKSADAIEETYDRHANEMRLAIEARTNDIFKKLIWKGSHFDGISLDEHYNLEVTDRYGMAARPDLSAGERQVLSLAFITAMAQVSGEEAPLVMDTPFGRLSSHHRNSITANLPKLASQLILFVTDEEFHGEARNNLKPYIGAEYRLQFDQSLSVTTIEEE